MKTGENKNKIFEERMERILYYSNLSIETGKEYNYKDKQYHEYKKIKEINEKKEKKKEEKTKIMKKIEEYKKVKITEENYKEIMKQITTEEKTKLRMYALDCNSIMIVSKYFERIEDYINLEIGCKRYR